MAHACHQCLHEVQVTDLLGAHFNDFEYPVKAFSDEAHGFSTNTVLTGSSSPGKPSSPARMGSILALKNELKSFTTFGWINSV